MNYHPLDCKKCKLCETRTQVVPTVIVENSRVMFISEAPGAEEDRKGIPFIGDAGKLLNEVLHTVGINRNDISIGNVVSCHPPNNRNPLPKEIDACFEFLDKEIRDLQPEVLVLLGNIPLKKFLKGSGGITKVNGKWFNSQEYNCKILPVFHPAYILRNPQEKPKIIKALSLLKDFLDGKVFNYDNHITTDYKVIKNINQFDWLIKQLNIQDLWVFDTETTGIDFERDDIFIFTFSWIEATAVLLDLREDWINKEYVWIKLKEVFENNSKKVAHNGSFDIKFLLSKNIVVKNYYCDTILMHHLIDENSHHGLEILADIYTDLGNYDYLLQQYVLQNNIKNYFFIPNEILYDYALKDADCTFRSYKKMILKIYEEKLDFVLFNITMPIQKILIQTEYQGVSIDVPYLDIIIERYEKDINDYLYKYLEEHNVKKYIQIQQQKLLQKLKNKWESSKTLLKKFPDFDNYFNYVKDKNKDSVTFSFNANSHKQLKELLIDQMNLPVIKTTNKGQPNLDSEVLQIYAKNNKFCEYLNKYRSLVHLKSTFLDGIKEKVKNGKVHTYYLLFSTVTGRLSSRNPNLNNIPRIDTASDIKDIFCSDRHEDGTSDWLVEADQGQAEFRYWIQYSKDPQALEDLHEGIDIHKLIAATSYHGKVLPNGHISYQEFKEMTKDVTKKERQDIKLVIFGLMYGSGVKSVSDRLGISITTAQKIINMFFSRYKEAKRWLDISVAIARRDGYVTSIFGRRRRLLNIKHPQDSIRSEAERQAKNSPIQSAASDSTFISCINVYNEGIKHYKLKSRLVLTVYDSLVFNVPDNELEFMVKLLYNKMSESPIPEVIVPLLPEIKVGKNWGSLMEIDINEAWNIVKEKLNKKFNNNN